MLLRDCCDSIATPGAAHHANCPGNIRPATSAAGPQRQPVEYRHDAINPEFLQFLAQIAGYAQQKYKDPMQYLGERMRADRGPINHARNHIGEYQRGVEHDHFGKDPRWQLAAAAYNLMMEFTYVSRGEAPDIWPPVNTAK